MPIIVKARKGDDNNQLIRKFKKFLQIDDVVEVVRDRRYHKTDAQKRKEKKSEIKNRQRIEAYRRQRNAQ